MKNSSVDHILAIHLRHPKDLSLSAASLKISAREPRRNPNLNPRATVTRYSLEFGFKTQPPLPRPRPSNLSTREEEHHNIMHVLPLLIAAVASAQTFAVHFNVLRGSSVSSATKRAPSTFHSILKRDETLSLSLEDTGTFFMADVTIDGQTFSALLDTGSSDFWVYASSNPYCESSKFSGRYVSHITDASEFFDQQSLDKRDDHAHHGTRTEGVDEQTATDNSVSSTLDCSEWGVLDMDNSTFTSNGSYFLIQYGDSTFAQGEWGTADIDVSGVTVTDFTFAVANQTNSTPVLGIGLEGNEASTQSFMDEYSPGGAFEYPNLPFALKNQGIIEKVMYSLYVDYNTSEGVVLFGGINQARYSGDLVALPLLNYYADDGIDTPITFDVALEGVSITGDGNTTDLSSYGSNNISVLLDSGTSMTYLPEKTVEAIASFFNAEYDEDSGAYVFQCPSLPSTITLNYKFDGVTIKVPVEEFVASDGNQETCALMISAADRYVLGDTFLRAAYVVFDLENLEVQMAQYQSTEDDDIVVVGPSGTSSGKGTSTGDRDASSTATSGFVASSDSSQTISTSSSSVSTDDSSESQSDSSSSGTASSGAMSKPENGGGVSLAVSLPSFILPLLMVLY